jgi:large subunit ribosomal protein L35
MKQKQKTKSAATKRFKITSSGKIKSRKAGMRHLLGHQSSKTKRNKRGDNSVADTDIKAVKRMIPGV